MFKSLSENDNMNSNFTATISVSQNEHEMKYKKNNTKEEKKKNKNNNKRKDNTKDLKKNPKTKSEKILNWESEQFEREDNYNGDPFAFDYKMNEYIKKGREVRMKFEKNIKNLSDNFSIYNDLRFSFPEFFVFFMMNHSLDSMADGLFKFDKKLPFYTELNGNATVFLTDSFNPNHFYAGFKEYGNFGDCYYQLNNMCGEQNLTDLDAEISIGYMILRKNFNQSWFDNMCNFLDKIDGDIISQYLENPKNVLEMLYSLNDYEMDFLSYSDPQEMRYNIADSFKYFRQNKIPIFLIKTFLYFTLMVSLKDLIIHYIIYIIMILGYFIFIVGILDPLIYNYHIQKSTKSHCWQEVLKKLNRVGHFNGHYPIYLNCQIMGGYKHVSLSTKPDPEMDTIAKLSWLSDKRNIQTDLKYKYGYELMLFIFSEKIIDGNWVCSEYTNNTSFFDLEFYTVDFQHRFWSNKEILAIQGAVYDQFDLDLNLLQINLDMQGISTHKKNAIKSCISFTAKKSNVYHRGRIAKRFNILHQKFFEKFEFLMNIKVFDIDKNDKVTVPLKSGEEKGALKEHQSRRYETRIEMVDEIRHTKKDPIKIESESDYLNLIKEFEPDFANFEKRYENQTIDDISKNPLQQIRYFGAYGQFSEEYKMSENMLQKCKDWLFNKKFPVNLISSGIAHPHPENVTDTVVQVEKKVLEKVSFTKYSLTTTAVLYNTKNTSTKTVSIDLSVNKKNLIEIYRLRFKSSMFNFFKKRFNEVLSLIKKNVVLKNEDNIRRYINKFIENYSIEELSLLFQNPKKFILDFVKNNTPLNLFLTKNDKQQRKKTIKKICDKFVKFSEHYKMEDLNLSLNFENKDKSVQETQKTKNPFKCENTVKLFKVYNLFDLYINKTAFNIYSQILFFFKFNRLKRDKIKIKSENLINIAKMFKFHP